MLIFSAREYFRYEAQQLVLLNIASFMQMIWIDEH